MGILHLKVPKDPEITANSFQHHRNGPLPCFSVSSFSVRFVSVRFFFCEIYFREIYLCEICFCEI